MPGTAFRVKRVVPPDEGIVGTTVLRPTLMVSLRPESPPIMPGSPDSLPTLEALLGLSNKIVTPNLNDVVLSSYL
jgi:hypothetical protein